jgi:xanthine dehydrogenase/oxidase
LINVNGSDGTVVVHHGGSDIGQGMHTKVAQVVAQTLGIDLKKVRIGDTDTDISPNSHMTAGSVSSEVCCEAARLACIKLNQELAFIKEELKKANPNDPVPWEKVVSTAKAKGICLQSTASFVPVGREDNAFQKPWKNTTDYFSYGGGVSEVEVDILTGENTIIRSDIIFDCGKSLNPIIDIGQAQGAFVFGIGFFTKEEVLIAPDGSNHSDSTWEYKPPLARDIPNDFRVELLRDSIVFPTSSFGQKGISEPPMALSYSIVSAIRKAIEASREERGLNPWLRVDCPMTVDVIQKACNVTVKDYEF